MTSKLRVNQLEDLAGSLTINVDNISSLTDLNQAISDLNNTLSQEIDDSVEGLLPYYPDLDTLTSSITSPSEGDNALVGGVPYKYSAAVSQWIPLKPLTAKDFGAVGDGSTDDTSALQQWLDSNSKYCLLTAGSYRVTSKLVSNQNGRFIFSEGGVLVGDVDDLITLEVNGKDTTVSLEIDGNDKAAIGVDITKGGCYVSRNKIYNLHGHSIGAAAVRADTPDGVFVTSNIIHDIVADSNDNLADNPGSSRAVLLSADTSANEGSLISNNIMYNITGEEGDAIQVLFNSGGAPFLAGDTLVTGNLIRNANRRSIKVQASGTVVANNRIINTFNTTQAPNLAAQIDVIGSNSCTIERNNVYAQESVCLQIAGATVDVNNNIVRHNTLRRNSTNDVVLFFDDSYGGTIGDNYVFGGDRAIAVGTTSGLSISGNEFGGGTSSDPAISTISSSSGIVIENNKVMNGSRSAVVLLNADDCIVRGNHSNVGVSVASTSSSSGCFVSGNTNFSTDPTLSGDFSNNITSNNFNLGSGNTSAGSDRGCMFWTESDPSTVFPNTTFNRGDVAFNSSPAPSGEVGWVCVTQGTPGTWKPFGAISA